MYRQSEERKFRVPKVVPMEEGEFDEMYRLNIKYTKNFQAIQHYLNGVVKQHGEASEEAAQDLQEEEDEHVSLMRYNEEENRRVAVLREQRAAEELEERLESAAAKKAAVDAKKERLRLVALQVLNETEEFAKTFYSPEDCYRIVEEKYTKPIDLNFAIDANGNIYRGRSMEPSAEESLESLHREPMDPLTQFKKEEKEKRRAVR